ncbi:hypothetical protein GHT06_009723 [Daphnia sinensis]|uniref:Protein kinase domain-containing protein n=1 Tax=Daphnia sinensis TaxID=1820382 RepID=A0AAD5LPN8_9CRUS|nr:hypothetical protein GHT06_009723 [Daphnia sinensis]
MLSAANVILQVEYQQRERKWSRLQTLNFPALACGDEENTNFQRMSIAYSIGEHAEADLMKIRTSVSSEEKKQRQIFEILLNENNCRGYFFDYVPRMNFKHLYLETCNDTLETYIRKSAMNSNFQWTILQEICCQLVDSVAWLHQRKFYYNGQLHPRNIFIKTCDSPWKVKLHLSEKANPFHSLDTEYVSSWTGIKDSDLLDKSADEIAIQKDLVSVTILMFFIQSSGVHPFQRASSLHPAERENYQCIQNQIKEGIFTLDALDRKCFCAANENENCEETQCKYRLWVNMLAKDRTDSTLTELFYETKSYNKESSGKLLEHPFFWKTSEVLRFIEKSSNYLKEAGDVKKKSLFGSSSQEQTNANGKIGIKKSSLVAIQRSQVHQPWLLDPVLLKKIKNNHKNIFDYLHEPAPARKPIPDIEFFCGLLSQIRNKSSHWNETTECGTKAKEDLKNMSFVADNEMDAQLKFCLFWNIHFPELILYTWKNLKDVIAHQ